MAEVILKDVMKIYPNAPGEGKKKKKKGEEPEKKHNLQITERGVVAVQQFNLSIADKEFIVLVGPSGCGKSTTLRMIAGLEEISEGEVIIDGRVVNDVPPKDRDIAMVFQNYALYPHMTVYDNMAFSLKLKKVDKATIDQKVREAAEILDITQYLDRKPKALSGGQRQRVAIGRAIVREPKVFLMDEPLSNLDAKLRLEMRQVIREIQHRVGITTVYVTHDQEEAMAISDKIAVMNHGDIQQIGVPKELYHRPHNEFVATFIGKTNMMDARLVHEGGHAALALGGVSLPMPQLDACANQDVRVSIRPEEFIKCPDGPIEATVIDSVYLGSSTDYFMSTGFAEKIQVTEESTFEENLRPGEKIRLRVNTSKINVFTADGARNLAEEVG